MDERDLEMLRRAIQVAQRARENGNHPFGAILVTEQGEILIEGENTVVTERDCTAHSETNLVRKACPLYDMSTLAKCTVYVNAEPCPMCAGALFWAGVGRVVYALSQSTLYAFNPNSRDRLLLSCREVMARGGRTVEVVGPMLEDEARQVHLNFWGNS